MLYKDSKSTDVYLIISKNIKKYRKKARMTQKDLAQKSGYSYAYIRRLEGPKCIKSFSVQTVYRLADALGIDIKQLFEK